MLNGDTNSAAALWICGCPSGTAEFYRYGTEYGTPLVVYSDLDCLTPIGSTATLSAAGRILACTKERADVLVKNAAGTRVFRFPFGFSDKLIELESSSFNGTLASGSQGAGGRALLNTALADLSTSFGARDFLVRKTGATTDQTLKDALVQSGLSLYFNVQDSTYGAVGNDTADDTVAILAAVAAAVAAGGGIVFFPEGTYRFTGELSLSSQKVTLMGCGSKVSVIKQYATTGNTITVSTALAECGCAIEKLAISALTSCTGSAIDNAVGNGLALRDCCDRWASHGSQGEHAHGAGKLRNRSCRIRWACR